MLHAKQLMWGNAAHDVASSLVDRNGTLGDQGVEAGVSHRKRHAMGNGQVVRPVARVSVFRSEKHLQISCRLGKPNVNILRRGEEFWRLHREMSPAVLKAALWVPQT